MRDTFHDKPHQHRSLRSSMDASNHRSREKSRAVRGQQGTHQTIPRRASLRTGGTGPLTTRCEGMTPGLGALGYVCRVHALC
jgi:hypothetical protein